MSFEINDSYKKTWKYWKGFNKKVNAIFFPIFKEFEETHLKDISGGALKLYVFLGLKARESGESWYSIKTMSESLGVSTRTVDKWLQELEDRGLVFRDRHSVSSTTYLIPYDFNLIQYSPEGGRSDLQYILDDMTRLSDIQRPIIGKIHRICQIFQWSDGPLPRCIQLIAVIARKSYPAGPPLYTAYVFYEQTDNPTHVINSPHITATKRFTSNLSSQSVPVLGLAVEKDYSLLQRIYQKDALRQLATADTNVLEEFSSVELVTLEDFKLRNHTSIETVANEPDDFENWVNKFKK